MTAPHRARPDWTHERIELLRALYPTRDKPACWRIADIVTALNRLPGGKLTITQVYWRATAMKLRRWG